MDRHELLRKIDKAVKQCYPDRDIVESSVELSYRPQENVLTLIISVDKTEFFRGVCPVNGSISETESSICQKIYDTIMYHGIQTILNLLHATNTETD